MRNWQRACGALKENARKRVLDSGGRIEERKLTFGMVTMAEVTTALSDLVQYLQRRRCIVSDSSSMWDSFVGECEHGFFFFFFNLK